MALKLRYAHGQGIVAQSGKAMHRQSGAASWWGILIVWVLAASAVAVAVRLYQLRDRPAQKTPATARAERPGRIVLPTTQPLRERLSSTPSTPPAVLLPGERCINGKYIREIPGGYEDDLTQDWKCRIRR